MIDINKFRIDYQCPSCGGDDFNSIREDIGEVIHDYYYCICGAEWTVTYSVSKIEVKDKNSLNEVWLDKENNNEI